MQSPCVLTNKAPSVPFSPSLGCPRLLGVGRGGGFCMVLASGEALLVQDLSSIYHCALLGTCPLLLWPGSAGPPLQPAGPPPPGSGLSQASLCLSPCLGSPAPAGSSRSWLSGWSHRLCPTQAWGSSCWVSEWVVGWGGPLLTPLPSTQCIPMILWACVQWFKQEVLQKGRLLVEPKSGSCLTFRNELSKEIHTDKARGFIE